jgi:hypothetical protein
MTTITRGLKAAKLALLASMASTSASAEGLLDLDLVGSFGENGFDRYVPAVTNPLFNETPFITTEVKPIYIYHDIPNDFLTGGGNVNVLALQARVALTDRLGFIATADGYSWLDFDHTLPDDSGLNDITTGLTYAVVSDPAAGSILTFGARYTIPVGTIETAGLDLNGTGAGYVDVFAIGAQLFDKAQIQGSVGANIALSDDNWSFIHGSLHADYEIMPGIYPLVEANLVVPIDGGNQLPGVNLTGADIIDIGASDPEEILSLAIGGRARLSDIIIMGAAFEKNILSEDITGTSGTEASVWGWRITTDLTIHF